MPNTNYAKAFLPLFSLFSIIRDDCVLRGFRGMNSEIWLLFILVCGYGSYGCTSRGCCLVLYRSYNSANVRSIGYRLKFLIDCGLIVKFKYKGRYRYRISSHAEKLILKSLGKDVIRDCALYIKSCLKD